MYPAMTALIDLGDREAVKKNAQAIRAVMTLPMEDAAYMPVHRELSEGKRALILRWIDTGMK